MKGNLWIVDKRKLITNLSVDFVFIILFFVIYQLSIFGNINVFGVKTTGGGIIPYGWIVVVIFIGWAVASMILALILWSVKKLNIKLTPLLIIAFVLPIIVYHANYNILINGSGAEFKEEMIIVRNIKNKEKNPQKYNNEHHMQDLKKYPIFVAEQENNSFYTYLYINESLDGMYIFMKRSPNSEARGNECTIGEQNTKSVDEYLADNKELENDECIVVDIEDNGIKNIEIYNNCAVLTKDDLSRSYFRSDQFKWLLEG